MSLTVANQRLNVAQELAAGFRHGVGSVGGVAAEVRGPDTADVAAQLQSFRELTVASTAGTAVFTLDPDVFAQALAEASRRGIPLAAVDNPPPADTGVRLFVGNDNAELGRLLADQIVGLLPRGTTGGTVVVGTSSPGAVALEERAAGLRAELKRLIPGVRVLGPFDTEQDVEAGVAWGRLIGTNPGALAFVGTGDADAYHLAAWRQRTKGRWVAGAFDLDPRSLAAVRRGDIVVVSPEHYLQGAVAGRLLAERAKDGDALPSGWIRTPGLGVTRANVDEIIARQAGDAAKQAWFEAEITQIAAAPVLRPMPAG